MDVEDYSAYLLDQAKSPSAAFHEFRISIEPGAKQIHVFVEGDEDIVFYLPDIRRRAAEREVFSYRCGGKKAVLETKNFVVSSGYDDELCLFFVDRDYDDFFHCQAMGDARLLVTEVYSIENHLTTPEALEIILSELVGIKKNDNTFRELKNLIELYRSIFQRKILPILAISLALREAGKKPNYNNLDIKKIFDIAEDGLVRRKKGAAVEVLKAFGVENHMELSLVIVAKWLKVLKSTPPDRAIRGKYDFVFFESCVIFGVKNVIRKKTCPYKIKLRNNLSNGGLLDSLAGRLPLPPYVGAFLDQALIR